MPTRRISRSARCADSGSGMRTWGLPRNPSVRPRLATAARLPFSSAALSAALASAREMPSNWPSAALVQMAINPARMARMKARIIAVAATLAIAAWAAYVSLRPAPAPHVRFATLAGESVSTDELRGKVVLVNFWATWCASCLVEMPNLVDTHRKYVSRGYETVAIAVQKDDPTLVAQFAARRSLPFTVALDTTGEVAAGFDVPRVTPVSYLIDRHGRVLKRYVGEPDWAELHAAIEEALGS
jgi:peroxiredoxin